VTTPPGRPLPGGAPDDGRPDPRLVAALAAAADAPSPAARAQVLAALAGARVFVAVRATAAQERASTTTGLREESSAQMELVCVAGSAGALAVPAFADGAAVPGFADGARPVPLPGPQACAAALEQGASALLLDPTGASVAVLPEELAQLAQGWVPVAGSDGLASRRGSAPLTAPSGPVDPALVAALAAALRDEPVTAARLLEGPDGLVLGLAGPGLDAPGLAALAHRLLARTRDVLPPGGLDLAQVEPQGPGVVVPLRRRGLLRRRR
jgi:hypothetical protein